MNAGESKGIKKTGQGFCCAAKAHSENSTSGSSIKAGKGLALQQLNVKGANCKGCVRKIELALQSVDGVTEAQMELSSGKATVAGTANMKQLIAALEHVGYQSTAAK